MIIQGFSVNAFDTAIVGFLFSKPMDTSPYTVESRTKGNTEVEQNND